MVVGRETLSKTEKDPLRNNKPDYKSLRYITDQMSKELKNGNANRKIKTQQKCGQTPKIQQKNKNNSSE